MLTVLHTIDSVNNVMLSLLQVGDPPAVVKVDKLNVIVDKQSADAMSHSLISTDMGSIALSGLVSDSACLQRKVHCKGLNKTVGES